MSYPGRPSVGYPAPKPIPRRYPPLAYNVDLILERYLPLAGEVLIAPNQRVTPETPIARCLLPGKPRLLNLAEYFDLAPKDAVKLVNKTINTRLAEGETIAQKKGGLRGKSLKAPFEAIISALDEDTGYLSLTPAATPFVLESHVPGTVIEIVPGWGAKIGLKASYIRGAVGIGGERQGVLRRIVATPNQPLTPEMIGDRAIFYILLGGSTVTAETLRRAVESKVRGIITGSMRAEELAKFLEYSQSDSFYKVSLNNWRFPADINPQDSPLTLVLTEGFGEMPMSGKVFEFLAAQDSYTISINGSTRLRRGWTRPEIIVPVSSSVDANRRPTNLNPDEQTPQIGSIVRLINPTMLGAVAKVTGIAQSRRPTATMLLDRQVEVEVLNTGQRLYLPLLDVEVLER
jgi:hypothetical protein